MKYIMGIDQSTQGTKAILFDQAGKLIGRADVPHRQIVDGQGWISHDPEEIFENVLKAVRMVVEKTKVCKDDIASVGISNQRETTVLWDQQGHPLADAIVWQCGRAAGIVERLKEKGAIIRERTGLPLSPYFPAAKMAWLMEYVGNKTGAGTRLHFGTIDSWLVYRLTDGKAYKTDYSNASRTQLFNLETLCWDEELCGIFGISQEMLPEVCDSNSCFGTTNFGGVLNKEIPIQAVLGDSHAALYGQGCHEKGMVKATYGTGSSIMMQLGDGWIISRKGLATSLAWGIDGKVSYVLEGNINYTGAVISWLKEELQLIADPKETEVLAKGANPEDSCILVPAFTGLSAPYWRQDVKAALIGMGRTTGKAEIVRTALHSIAFQINDVLKAMEEDTGCHGKELRVDGGPTKNGYLMQFQSDLSDRKLWVSEREELSAKGAAYLAGITAGIYEKRTVSEMGQYQIYTPCMEDAIRQRHCRNWENAVNLVLDSGHKDCRNI